MIFFTMNNFHHINKIILKGLFFSFIIYFISCNAPRNNPLDPDNPNNNFGSIQGVVQTFSLPFTGIEDATVYWPPANKLVKTNANGKFIINWSGVKIISPQVNLNSIPNLDSVAIFTTVINQFNPDQTFQLNILAKVSDRDNDIDSVIVSNDHLRLNKKLDYNISQNFFQMTLYTNDLNISDLEEVIGLDFNIIVYDRFKNIYNVGSGKVTRVIKTQVLVQSPANSDIVNSNPTLTWQKFKPGYPFTYIVEVYTNDFANSQLVLGQKGVSPDSISYFVKNALQPGDYYWVLWVIDQFQNRARSKPATFTVK